MTARWVVDEVQPQRDLEVTWQPISLFFKNEPDEDSDGYERLLFTHKLLRVLESVREAEGNDAVQTLYWEFGARIHHDRDRGFDVADALATAGLDLAHAAAADDEERDAEIRKRMDIGLELVGDNVGTPIIAFDDDAGHRVGLFGPVITRAPKGDQATKLWDGLMAVASIPGFWELKRTRTERPEFGDRPS